MINNTDTDLILYMAGCTLAKVPGNNNWLEEKAVGGLPEYICRIARAIHKSDASKSISQVIAIAVSRAKAWAAGGGGVTAKTRAKAAKAVAEWESKKKAAKLDNKVKASYEGDITLFLTSSFNVDDVRRQYRSTLQPRDNYGEPYSYVREMWTDFLIVEEEANGSAKSYKVPYTVDAKNVATFGEKVEVKQTYVELSHPDLQTSLTDAQLEKAAMIPCTQKFNGSLSEMVALAGLQKKSDELMRLSKDKPNLAALIQMANRR